MKKTIAVDFDGVIHKYSKGWQDGSIYDYPVEGALQSLALLVKVGFNVVIFTTREEREDIKIWMHRHYQLYLTNLLNEGKLKLNEASEWSQLLSTIEVTNKKPIAFAYIDDRAIRFTNWTDTLKYFI